MTAHSLGLALQNI